MENEHERRDVEQPQTVVSEATAKGDSTRDDEGILDTIEAVLASESGGDGEVVPSDAIVQLVNEVKEAVKARDEWQDKYLRAAAEYANAKRRAELRASNDIWAARERLLGSILPVLDDFERAFDAVPAEERQSSWVAGFGLIQRKLQGILEREGVSEIAAAGQPFDPNLHQAMMIAEGEGVPSGTVLEVLQKGYLLEDRVLRPSMVKVAQ